MELINPLVQEYAERFSSPEDALLKEIADFTYKNHPESQMLSGHLQGKFLEMASTMIRPRRILEIGTFTGYSALWVAQGLPADGRIIACDVSEEYTAVAKRYWKEAGVDQKIDLRLRPALETLDALIKEGQSGTFDFAFIDADKTNYQNYYERCLQLLRAGGVIAIDNTIWSGKVADRNANDEDTVAIRQLNQELHRDERVSLSMLTVGDGLTLAMKR